MFSLRGQEKSCQFGEHILFENTELAVRNSSVLMLIAGSHHDVLGGPAN